MITLADISFAVSRVLPRYDVREAYLFGDLCFVCGDCMTFGTLYEISLELEEELGRAVEIMTNPREHMRPAFRNNIEQDEVCLYKAK